MSDKEKLLPDPMGDRVINIKEYLRYKKESSDSMVDSELEIEHQFDRDISKSYSKYNKYFLIISNNKYNR